MTNDKLQMTNDKFVGFGLLFAIIFTAMPLMASDWPRWLGPNGDNIAPEGEHFDPDLSKWKIAWTAEVGLGFSSIAVSGDAAYTMGHDGKGKETVYRLDAATGAVVWKYPYDAKLMPNLHTGGPNATPTLSGNKLITLSKDGQVFCLTADKGEFVWKANLLNVLGIKMPDWGFASSAVVDGNQVLFCSGKAGALELETGKALWTSKTAYLPAGYATLPVFELDGRKFAAALDGKGFTVISATDGAEIAHRPFNALFDMNATTPFILSQGKRILISNTIQSEMLAFDGQKLTPIWIRKDLRNLMNNSVIQDGAIYGISGEQQQPKPAVWCRSMKRTEN